MKILSFLFFSFLLLSACERQKTVAISLPEIQKPVIYAIISPEEGVTCCVTTSKSVVGKQDFQPIPNATVILIRNNNNYDTLTYRHPFYYSSKKVLQDGEYTLFVNFDNYSVKTGKIRINPKTPILSSNYFIHPDSVLLATMSFLDDEALQNAYSNQIYLINHDSMEYIPQQIAGPTGNSNFQLTSPIEFKSYGFHYLDSIDNGMVHEFNREIKLTDSPFYDFEIDSVAGIKYILVSLSPEIINFYKSLRENKHIEIGSSTSPDPSWTNIIGGYGYFGAYRKDSVILVW